MEQKQTVKTHRVGTITFGSLLILFGTLFLARMFLPALNYAVIFHLWPFIFIFLGIEVLLANRRAVKEEREEEKRQISFVYDKAAIFLIIGLSFFAMIMAVVDSCLSYEFMRQGRIWIP